MCYDGDCKRTAQNCTCVFWWAEQNSTQLFAQFNSIAHECIILPTHVSAIRSMNTRFLSAMLCHCHKKWSSAAAHFKEKTYHRHLNSLSRSITCAVMKPMKLRKKRVQFIVVIFFFPSCISPFFSLVRFRCCMQIFPHTFQRIALTFPHEYRLEQHFAFFLQLVVDCFLSHPPALTERQSQWIRNNTDGTEIYEIKIWLKKFACKYVRLKDKFISWKRKKKKENGKTKRIHNSICRLSFDCVVVLIHVNCFPLFSVGNFVQNVHRFFVLFRSFSSDETALLGDFIYLEYGLNWFSQAFIFAWSIVCLKKY